MIKSDLDSVVKEFRFGGNIAAISRLGSGHINDSYLINTLPENGDDYVLQRINHHVFKDIEGLTSNILKVTRHLKQKLSCSSADYGYFQVIQMIPTLRGEFFHHDPEGNFWRLYTCIKGSHSYDIVENPKLAYEGGKATGIFQYLTSDMDAASLVETIPDFHHIAARLIRFRDAVNRDPEKRVDEIRKEISFLEDRADEMHTILRLGCREHIPLRVTHNDTKFNNILFDHKNKSISLVDLDTVMPGFILYDFGDAIRTGANTGAEDEPDLSKIDLDLNLFQAYADGYLESGRKFLVPAETGHLAFSAKFMTYLIGLRFLTDHIEGDTYYKIHFPGHNLQRARAQFRLLEIMEIKYNEMQQIINKLLN